MPDDTQYYSQYYSVGQVVVNSLLPYFRRRLGGNFEINTDNADRLFVSVSGQSTSYHTGDAARALAHALRVCREGVQVCRSDEKACERFSSKSPGLCFP